MVGRRRWWRARKRLRGTGEAVFPYESTSDMLRAQMRETPLAPSRRLGGEFPEQLERVIMRCLEKRPEDRYRGAAELRGAG